MTSTSIRYNPGFRSDEELIESFVVRLHDLEVILEVLKDNSGPPNRHILIVGPRGVGKTTLVRRVAAEIRTSTELAAQWYPLVFAEESYEVSSPGELWLLALFHLANQTQSDRWLRAYEDLKKELDETRLRERALAQLLDFADEQGKRILLTIENLNMLVGDQLDKDAAWDLRHTLLNEPRLMLLGSATTRFEAIENVEHALYEIFLIHELLPLSEPECKTLWEKFTGEEQPDERIRPIQILTGGNPRLISVLATFARDTSFRELMDNLIQLIDDHTEYFKSQLDGLSPIERKVFVALLDLWDPSAAQKIAQAARMDVNTTSSLLGRLAKRGAVTVIPKGRKKYYQAAERLYNIYYLMRRRGHPSQRVHAVVAFMVQFYEGDQLIHTTAKLAEEACQLAPERRQDHYWAYEDIINTAPKGYRTRIIRATPKEFFSTPDIPENVRHLAKAGESDINEEMTEAELWVSRGDELRKEIGRIKEAEDAYHKAIEIDEQSHDAWYGLGAIYDNLGRVEEAERALRKAVELVPDSLFANMRLGLLLQYRLKRIDEAKNMFIHLTELYPQRGMPWAYLGNLYANELNDYESAEHALRKAVEIASKSEFPLIMLGDFLSKCLKSNEEAEQVYKKALELNPERADAWAHIADFYLDLDRYEEAEVVARKAIELDQSIADAWATLGIALHMQRKNYEEAEQVFRKLVELTPDSGWAWAHLGHLLAAHLDQREQAEAVLRKAVELSPEEELGWENLGVLLSGAKKYEEAELALRKAIEVAPESDSAWETLGTFFTYDVYRPDEAEPALLKAVELTPSSESAWRTLTALYENLGDKDKVEQVYRRWIQEQPGSYLAWGEFGHFLEMTLERYREAEAAYRKAIELKPDASWIWSHLGRLLYLELDQPVEAEQAFKQSIEVTAESHWNRIEYGLFLEYSGKYEEAEQSFRKAIEIKFDAGRAWLCLGELLSERLENASEAEVALRKAIEFGETQGWLNLISLYLTRLNAPEAAIEHAKQFLQESGASPYNFNNLAWLLYESGKGDYLHQAEEWARAAVASEPTVKPEYAHTLITILGAQGKWQEALKQMPSLLDATATEEKAIADATDATISLAAAGFAKECLELVINSAGAAALEPLSAGLRLFVGEPEYIAKEIYEVGKDVADQIRKRQKKPAE